MVRDFKYIINRILIGVFIALLIMVFKQYLCLSVSALGISSANTGALVQGLDNTTGEVVHNVSGGQWANWGTGYLYFDFSLMKVNGTSTSFNVFPRSATATSGGINYLCSIGSASTGNSTFNNSVFSAKCPMVMASDGLTKISVQLQDFQSNSPSEYTFIMGGLKTFEQIADTNFTVDTSTTTNAINNQISNDNSNTQSIINNQDSNTQDIIDNQNSNTDKEIESQKVCSIIDKKNIVLSDRYLTSSGNIIYQSYSKDWGITDYISVQGSEIEKLSTLGTGPSLCFYNINKELISCSQNVNVSVGKITIPNNTSFVRFSISITENKPQYKICTNGNQAIVNSQENINNTLNDDTVDTEQTGGFFNSFQTNSHGLSGIITSPLRLIQSLSSSQCSPLVLPLPFVNQSATIPCMSTIYSKFPTFLNLWQLISTGLIAYYILVNLFAKVHSMQNPQDDRIEVLNL